MSTGVFQTDAPDSAPRPRPVERPPTLGDVVGAHFTLGRQDFIGAPLQAEIDAYGPLVEALERDVPDNRDWLSRTLQGPRYVQAVRGGNPVNATAVWRDIAAKRRADPSYLQDVPAKSASEFAGYVKRIELDRRRGAQSVASRQSGVVQGVAGVATDIGTGLLDPVNLATLPIGGASRTLIGTMAREALINTGVEAFELPMIAANREAFGEDFTAADAGADLLTAAAGGAAFPLIGRGVKIAAGKGADVVAAFRERVPAAIHTPDERAALHVLDREAEIHVANPYPAGPAGMEAHATNLAGAMQAILDASKPLDPGVPRVAFAPVLPHETLGGPGAIDAVIAKVRGVESGGNDAARNARSSAAGRYQFTDATFVRTYKAEVGAGNLSDADILARKMDPTLQDRLMRRLTGDNARALAADGAPVTPGTLYLAHFAGSGGAKKLLRAAEGASAERVLGGRAIAANPFLRGMSAADVVAWADRKMGGGGRVAATIGDDVGGVTLRDPALDAARPAIDDPDAVPFDTPDAVRASEAAIDAPIDATQLQRAAAGDHEAMARVEVADSAARMSEWREQVATLKSQGDGEIIGAAHHPEIGPIDVIWGDATHGLAKIIARHPEVVDELPAIIERLPVVQRPRDPGVNRYVLEDATHKAVISPDFDGNPKHWVVTAYEKKPPPGRTSRRGPDDAPDGGSTGTGGEADIAAVTPNINPPAADVTVSRFADPSGPDARAQADGVTHDLRQAIDTGKFDGVVFATDTGRHVAASQIMASLDADDAAVAAIRACL